MKRKEISKLNDQIIEFLELSDIYALLDNARRKIGVGTAFRHADTSRTVTCSTSSTFTSNTKSFPLSEVTRIYECHKVTDGKDVYGYLILDRQLPEKVDFIVEALVIGLRFFFRKIKLEEHNKHLSISRFLRDLLLDKIPIEQEIRKRGELLGIIVDEEVVVLSIGGLPPDADELLLSRLNAFFRKPSVIAAKNVLVCILFIHGMGENALTENIRQLFQAIHSSYTPARGETKVSPTRYYCGVSGKGTSLMSLHRRYLEANDALAFSYIFNREEPTFSKELGAFKQICTFARTKESKDYVKEILGELIEHDKTHHTNLLFTLEVIESCNYNLSLAAEKLFCHYNTVKYRYNKIQGLLKEDIKDSAFHFDVSFALRVHEARKKLHNLDISVN